MASYLLMASSSSWQTSSFLRKASLHLLFFYTALHSFICSFTSWTPFLSAVTPVTRAVLLLVQLEGAAEGEPKAHAQKGVDEATSRMAKFSKQLEDLRSSSLPKVEVGSLEEVISKMENDTQGDWNSVMFVPTGSVDLAPPPTEQASAQLPTDAQ